MTKIYFIIALFGLWNFIVFLLYAFDKYKAKHQLWRISEKTLLIATLCLGGIGGLIAIYVCQHKIRKSIFLATALLSCMMIVAFFGYLTSLPF
ncbi:DUF1294 domain-containing protein [Facklamia sp. 7083-14-GEN3]|uniref:DUF1294 domain-containing protein n=1 Tax=Facklamia sp. 7083-14-GEN3 TaxID=2973478 RepID=UPI00215D4D38|nr:DUF1294 domain-containing protein [Facklamia sp. 7083-14-GEN3]MCR8968864.1 DUF1294 domain-containing protein [Facklamia sp. 7083-14-GEN3]